MMWYDFSIYLIRIENKKKKEEKTEDESKKKPQKSSAPRSTASAPRIDATK